MSTIFFGGGTPTLLPAEHLGLVVDEIAERFGLADGVEITTEANPESVTPGLFRALRAGGFTRVSVGMQSAVPHVLRTLDRVHSPGRALAAAREAHDAGFEHVSLDLIYGTPGESDADWEQTLELALSAEDATALSGLGGDVDDLVGEMESLRGALDEAGQASRGATATGTA